MQRSSATIGVIAAALAKAQSELDAALVGTRLEKQTLDRLKKQLEACVVKAPSEGFDVWDPANVSPFVAFLASEECEFTGETFIVQGGKVQRVQS